jgi:choline dehydrogenase-like flavoprotein
MVGLEPKGMIKLNDGVAEIHCQSSPSDLDKLRCGMVRFAEIYLAGGAKAVYPGTQAEMTITSKSDLQAMTQAIRSAADVMFGSAHPQGGNAMCDDPKRGVVGLDFRVHGIKNLYVADTSVFPSNLWANCQATAMAMGYLAADSIMRGAAARAG